MSLMTVIKGLFGIKSGKDRNLVCDDCRKKFVFDEGEQKFFKAKGFTDPKRCPSCRKKAKGKVRFKGRGRKNNNRYRNSSRRHSIIDGDSPYADE